MMPLNHKLGKFTGGYKLGKSKEKINLPNVHGRHQTVCKNEKELEPLTHVVRIPNQGIEMELGIEKCAMQIMKSRKRHLTEEFELPNQEQIRTLKEKERYKYLGKLEADTIKLVERQKKLKRISRKNKNATRNQN